MTKTYAQIIKQIETLKQDAEKVRRKEVAGVVSRIQEAIAVYGLTAADLGFDGKKPPKAKAKAAPTRRKAAKRASAPAAVKYRNDSGGTWGGRGKRPDWLRAALAEGKSLDDFAVK